MSDKAIGFFGPYEGMTEAQLATVERLLEELAPDAVHHRSTIGADMQFDALAAKIGIWREAHPSLMRRYHVDLACDVIHEVDSPGSCRDTVARAAHIIVNVVAVGEARPVMVSVKPTVIVQPDGNYAWISLAVRFLSSPQTPFENANFIEERFKKSETIPASVLKLFSAEDEADPWDTFSPSWRTILEKASPLYYARLVEAMTLAQEREQELVRQGTSPDEMLPMLLQDPIEGKPEFARVFHLAFAMAEHIEADKHRITSKSEPDRLREMYPGPSGFNIIYTAQWILREQYGIMWFTEEEMNPFARINYD